MAKLRDTAVKDNLNIAGSVVAGGKVLSVEGHTHTPANITGLDTYINQKIQAAGGTSGSGTPAVTPSGDINAKTLDGHPASDFVLKTESIGSGGNDQYQVYMKSVLHSSSFQSHLIIELSEELTNECQVYIEDNNSIILLDKRLNPITLEMKNAPASGAFNIRNTALINYTRASGISNIAIFNLNMYNHLDANSYPISIKIICNKDDINKFNISSSASSKYSSLSKQKMPYDRNLKNFLLQGDVVNMNTGITNQNGTLFRPYFKYNTPKGIMASTNNSTFIIIDLDDGKFINFSNNTWWGPAGTETNSVYSYDTNGLYLIDLTGFSDKNTVIFCRNSFAIPVPFNSLAYGGTKVSKTTSTLAAYGYDIDKLSNAMKVTNKITINGTKYNLSDDIIIAGGSGGGEINCNINGIHFDGKTDITIPAPTNALTLGGLDSSQYIKATDVGNSAGKIPRFDNDGFLVYPDGSKERIENA